MNGETTPRRARRRRQLFKNHASSYLDVEDIDDFFGTQEQVGPLLFPKSPSSLSSLAARPVEMSSARLKSIILTTTAAATQHRAGAPRGGDNNNSPGSTEVSQTRELQQQFGVKRNIRAHSQRDVPSTILSTQSSLSSVPASRATEADNCEENEGNEDAAVHEGLNSTTHDDSQAKVPLTKRIHHFKTKYKQTLLRPITTPAPKLNLTTSPKLSRVNRPFMVPERDGQQQHQRERQLEAESGSSTLGGSAEVGRRSLSSRHSVEMQAAGQRFFLGDRVWVRITQDAADTALLHPKENAGEGEEGYYCVGTVVDIEELRYTVECDSGITNIQVMDTTCSAHPDEPANADGRLDEPMAPFKLRRGDRVLARPPRRRRLAQATVIYPPVANGNGHAVIPKNATELAPRRPQRRAAKKGFNKEVFFVVEFDDGGLHWANTAEVRWRPAQVPATTLPPQQGGSAVNHNGKGAENKSAGRIDGSTCMGGEGDDEHRNSHGEDGRSTRLGGARKVSAQPAASSSSWVAREPPADEVEPFFAGMVFAITIAADAKPTAMGGPPSRRGRQQLMRSKALSALSSHPSAGRATVELDKERLTRWIRSRGGTVLDTFMDCLEFCRHRKLSTSPDPANRTIFMVSDAPSTTAKYLLALTCGFPVVSGTWIAECVLNNRLEDHRPFRLANGWSAEMGAMSVCTHVPRFMGGVTILVHGSSQFKLNWETILGLAGARLAKLPTATTSREWNTVSCDFVLSERKPTNSLVERVTARCARIDAESQPQWETQHVATDVDEDGNTKTSWFVSHHWAKQCIINQRIVRHNGHPSYSVYTK
ncbi:hypothetical protein EV182_002730 [Spiromyces aspiralis]|uniref:Uncharacterized protein n=1 Tax=Spiromyces aspiralis TaxID=68401 RepID=A0ACC1HHW3_9FUNG|nr:hypothetical protein EV182_002730 [Spiromyces aspiralis]